MKPLQMESTKGYVLPITNFHIQTHRHTHPHNQRETEKSLYVRLSDISSRMFELIMFGLNYNVLISGCDDCSPTIQFLSAKHPSAVQQVAFNAHTPLPSEPQL